MPLVSSVHTSAALAELSILFGQNKYVSDQLAPVLPVKKQSDTYYIIDVLREDLRQSDVARAPGTPAKDVDYAITTDTYTCKDHALGGVVSDEERENADVALQPEIDKTEFITGKILLDKEIRLQAALVASVANTAAAAAVWSDYTTGDPVANVRTAKQSIMDDVLEAPNVMVIDWKTWTALRDHPDIVERIKYNQTPGTPAVATTSAVAQVFDLEQILVSKCFKNTALHGAAATTSAVWGTDAWLAYVAPRPGLRVLTAAMTFEWSVAGGRGTIVEKWRDDKVKGDRIRIQRYYDQKVISTGAYARITSVIS